MGWPVNFHVATSQVRRTEMPFADRYGPWALVAGASEGVGEAYAHAMAERGLNVILLSRRQAALDEVAAAIRQKWSVEALALAVDLTESDAMSRIVDTTADLEIGMLMYCAGADPNFQPFLDKPVDVAVGLVQRNCIVPLQLCHRIAGDMVSRGQGGIVLVSSGAGLVGARNMVAYSASKAFDMVMGEALWAELHDKGVDVLSLVLGVTDTPALRRLLLRRGNLAGADDPIPDASTPSEAVADALAHLSDGPTWFVGEQLREGSKALGQITRSEAAKMLVQVGAGIMDARPGEGDGASS
jgi:short-subunit dehydrogenase